MCDYLCTRALISSHFDKDHQTVSKCLQQKTPPRGVSGDASSLLGLGWHPEVYRPNASSTKGTNQPHLSKRQTIGIHNRRSYTGCRRVGEKPPPSECEEKTGDRKHGGLLRLYRPSLPEAEMWMPQPKHQKTHQNPPWGG